MGTEITLSVDSIDVCWSKNSVGIDHGALYQESDRKQIKSDQINYQHFESNDDSGLPDMEMGFVKNLKDVASRIEMLGFNIESIRNEYNHRSVESNENYLCLDELEGGKVNSCMPFDQFLGIMKSIKISSLSSKYDSQSLEKNPAEYGSAFISSEQLLMIPFFDKYETQVFSEQSLVAEILGFLHPYSALRLLAENKDNLNQEVRWDYGELVENGWAKLSEFQAQTPRNDTFLIVTEGHSDTDILKLAISTLRPEILDFFYFIDMTEGHPFGGTASLQKFAKGLTQIDVHNQTVFLFDNDTEGLSAYNKTNDLNLPMNMKVIMLPDINEFQNFMTLGPNGKAIMDINGKAAAIECYLDLKQPGLREPSIRWSTYKGDVKQYQGALLKKDSYAKDFLKRSTNELIDSNYNLSKLALVIDTITRECISIASDLRTKNYLSKND